MFETLSKGFRAAKQRLTGVAELNDEVIDEALRDVRMSLLEADVEFSVVKRFLQAVKEKALGEKVQLVAKKAGETMRVRTERGIREEPSIPVRFVPMTGEAQRR